MFITITQLRAAVRKCTPGAPDSYADRLWAELRVDCECDTGSDVLADLPDEPYVCQDPAHLTCGCPKNRSRGYSGWTGLPAAGGSVYR